MSALDPEVLTIVAGGLVVTMVALKALRGFVKVAVVSALLIGGGSAAAMSGGDSGDGSGEVPTSTEELTEQVEEWKDQAVAKYEEVVPESTQEKVSNLSDSGKEWVATTFTEENVNRVLDGLQNGIDTERILENHNSDKGVLPTEIRSIDEIAESIRLEANGG